MSPPAFPVDLSLFVADPPRSSAELIGASRPVNTVNSSKFDLGRVPTDTPTSTSGANLEAARRSLPINSSSVSRYEISRVAHRRHRSDTDVYNQTNNHSWLEESADLALEDFRKLEKTKYMAIDVIIGHLVENPRPDHPNWRSLIQRALTNVTIAKTPDALQFFAIQKFSKAWEKLLRRGVQKDNIRFTAEEVAGAVERALHYTQDKNVELVAQQVLQKVGHPTAEDDAMASAASTKSRESEA